jgi:GT2 family glycosyltransferase
MSDSDEMRPLMVVEQDLPEGPEPGTVMIGYLSGSNVSNLFLQSMLTLQRADSVEGFNRIQHRNWWLNQRSGVNVARARNTLVAKFLAMRDPAPEWLLMVDADMSFNAGALESLIRAADVPDRMVIGGLCIAFGADPDKPGENALMSTVFDAGEPLDGIGILPFQVLKPAQVQRGALRECYGTGAAFLLVHRQVLLDIAYMTSSKYGWFREIIIPDEREDVDMFDANDYWVSEDLFFCLQARAAGHRVFVHTGVEVQHAKSIKLTEKLWRSYARIPESA